MFNLYFFTLGMIMLFVLGVVAGVMLGDSTKW